MKKTTFTLVGLLLSLLLCVGLTACSDATVDQLQNEALGAILEGGNFTEGSALNLDAVDRTSEEAEDIFEKLEGISAYITDRSKALIYDISVTKDGKEVQPDGTVKLTIPVPQGSTETDFTVFHVKDSGEAVKIAATCADGKITFETDGFSYYVIVATTYVQNTPDIGPSYTTYQHKLTVTPAAPGSWYLEINGERKDASEGILLDAGETHVLEVVIEDGWRFEGWYDADTNELLSTHWHFELFLNKNRNLMVKLTEAPRRLMVDCRVGGRVTVFGADNTGTKVFYVDDNATVTLTAVANDGYVFDYWLDARTGETLTESETLTITMDVDRNVQARFKSDDSSYSKYQHKLTVTPAAPGSWYLEINGERKDASEGILLDAGETHVLEVVIEDGWRFEGWYDADTNELLSTHWHFELFLNKNRNLMVKLTEAPRRLMVDCRVGGRVTVFGADNTGTKVFYVDDNATVTLTAVANDGYVFDYWLDARTGETLTESETLTITMDVDRNVQARFKSDDSSYSKYQHKLTVTPAAPGSWYLEINGERKDASEGILLDAGETHVLEVVIEDGWRFEGWYDADTNELLSTHWHFELFLNKNRNLMVKLTEAPRRLMVDCRVGGRVTVFGADNTGTKVFYVDDNATVTLTAVANDGYVFDYWLDARTGETLTESETLTITMDVDRNVQARFKRETAEVSFTVSPAGAGYFELSDGTTCNEINDKWELDQRFGVRAVANFGYRFLRWEVQSGELAARSDRIDGIVEPDGVWYKAVFEELPNQLTVTATEGGKFRVTKVTGQQNTDQTPVSEYKNAFQLSVRVSLEAEAEEEKGYYFVGWFDEQGEEVDVYPEHDVVVMGKVKLEARFEKDATDPVETQPTETQPTETQPTETQPTETQPTETDPVDPQPTEYRLLLRIRGDGEIYAGAEPVSELYANGVSLRKGTTVVLTAVADEGKQFAGWYTSDGRLISEAATYTFEMNAHIVGYAQFEEKTTYTFIAAPDPYSGGYIEENNRVVDFGNGREVAAGTKIKLTAVANEGYTFRGWGTRDDDWKLTILSTEETYEFTVTEDTYVYAVFEAKVTAIELDASNAGFTYETVEGLGLVLADKTVVQTNAQSFPAPDAVVVYGVRADGSVALTKDTDYTIDLGGLDFTKAGVYTITYTYKQDTSLTATLTVEVKAAPSDGRMTEAEWNAAISYWKAQTNVKAYERTVTSQSDDPQYGALGADIRIYQLAGNAYSSDGYMENEVSSQQYKGKMTYLVKKGNKYYRYTWNDGEWDNDLGTYVGGFWKKDDYLADIEFNDEINSNIYGCRDSNGELIVFSYANFTYDAETKSYKNSDGSISIAFTFDDKKVLTQVAVTTVVIWDGGRGATSVRTITFGDAVVNVPTAAKCSVSTAVKTENLWDGTVGYITENGARVEYGYDYLDDGTVLTLTAVANDGYVFKRWAKEEIVDSTCVWVTYSTDATYVLTVDGAYGTLYAVFEAV